MHSPKKCVVLPFRLSEFIALSGVVRHLCAGSTTDVMLLADRDHVSSLRALFVGVPGLRFMFVLPEEVPATLKALRDAGCDIVRLRGMRVSDPYAAMSIPKPPLEVDRHPTAEAALLHATRQAHGDGYVVVHGDGVRVDLLPQRASVVRLPPSAAHNIFNWVGVLEHAAEFHATDSSYLLMADALSLRTRKFLHAYASAHPTHKYSADVVTIW